MELTEKVANLPAEAGVYLFKDALGTILYVGKARSLRSRVRSYFLESSWADAKTGSLVREIADFDYIVVDNEREALALENNLIKQYQPEVQRPAARRQDLSVHPLHRIREISARLRHAPAAQGRLALLRPVFPAQPGAPHRALHSQDIFACPPAPWT